MPRCVTALVLALLAVLLAASAAAAGGNARRVGAVDGLEPQVLAALNAARAERGLPALRLSRPLSAAADVQSRAMATRGFFAHESPDGSPFWKRVQRFYGESGYGLWSVGENLLWSSPDVDAQAAIKLWLASPKHRENMLDPRWREVGLAAVHADSAPGTYGGRAVTIVTAEFGVRR